MVTVRPTTHFAPSLLLRRFVFRMAEASAKRVTGDEPQGTMGRVQTAGFPPSFARTFSSKERRLGTRQLRPSPLTLDHIQCIPPSQGTLRIFDSASCKEMQDSFGFWIQRCGFRIIGTGLQYLSVELGFWIP